MTCFAPTSCPISRRAAIGSTRMIVAQPWITAPITAASPTGPPPKIAILDPAGQASEFITRSEEHTSELQSLMRNSYAVFCLKKKKTQQNTQYSLIMDDNIRH